LDWLRRSEVLAFSSTDRWLARCYTTLLLGDVRPWIEVVIEDVVFEFTGVDLDTATAVFRGGEKTARKP
jgi:ketosteroid isomerase-like protein